MEDFYLYVASCLLVILVFLAFKIASQNKKITSLDSDRKVLENRLDSSLKANLQLSNNNQKLSHRNSELEIYSSALDADKEARDRLEQAKLDSEKIVSEANSKASNIVSEANSKASNIVSEADSKASSIISAAKSHADNLTEQAYADLNEAKSEAAETRKNTRDLLRDAKADAEFIKEDAARQASAVIEEAKEKAKSIAGEAYDIAEKANHYQEVAKAMKNIIEGYGDEYLKPTYSVLDGLAEEFGYTEAGQKLKDAREKTKALVNSGNASKCDYAENNRRTTAENFVLDAFNGKVDTILSLIKKDNVGILERKIRDSYAIVNRLGTPFRNARITEIYLDARLDELKWAVVVNELKLQEREEQRRIREQIREEEKARREYERAMKEAAKEEETIRKAMEKAQLAIDKASAEQKAKYEAQLADLQVKLQEAEAKNQRALSMAQQTKSGHVYIISNVGSFGEEVFKIGMTRRLEPMDRVKELGDASVPFPFDVHAMIYSDDAPSLETALHKYFVRNQVNKVNPKKEFFRIPISEIRKEIDKRGLEVKWTMAAAASEYRETLAIEKAMQTDQSAQDKWLKNQESIKDDSTDEESLE